MTLKSHLARKHGKKMKGVVAADAPPANRLYLIKKKVWAAHQSADDGIGGSCSDGWRTSLCLGDGVEASIDVQRTEFAVWACAVPIVEAVGDIAALLDLCDKQARTDGVHCTSWNKNTVSRLCKKRMEHFLATTCPDGLGKDAMFFVFGNFWIKS